MPRMSEAEKQRSHSRILDAAAQLFRERGVEATSVADVMKTAGMTHGGFYRHFDSKEDLIAASFRHAVDDVVSDMEREETSDGRKKERQDYIAKYLSQAHAQDSRNGCPLAAMGTELARTTGAPHQAGAQASDRMAALLQDTSEIGSGQGLAAMALLMGTITLARLTESEEKADRALEAGRTAIGLLQDYWPKERS
ncbi:TetR/AcrR family transcriptional regulator [Ruegeria sp. R13_0]|uniref:TetR/AcrR family transcriptional regulator n=1 Tax=Ruegeria sp. R13_0 TaxID=2821099 RepID=UPI001ADA9208|nr:TetR/AcrR family transcriptional regulator [Ruegeria sp. R13_0]MBO9433601.1 TetR/AcrR family transcriptional regulator [Ruegeria sp. R13_0]